MNVFTYHGVELPLFGHMYNLTWLNERGVEVAIAHRFLGQLDPGDVAGGLEVGNVLGHYSERHHSVIDLHEPAAWYQRGQDVVAADLLDLIWPSEHLVWPWVISLSTIEHTDDPSLALRVLRSLVAPGGRLLVTWPMGVHGVLDDAARADVWARATTMRCELVDGLGLVWTSTPEILSGPLREQGWPSVVFVGEWEAPS